MFACTGLFAGYVVGSTSSPCITPAQLGGGVAAVEGFAGAVYAESLL